jgi:hypothetical protein
MVVNPVGDGLAFEVADNSGVVLTADGTEVEIPVRPEGPAGRHRLGPGGGPAGLTGPQHCTL